MECTWLFLCSYVLDLVPCYSVILWNLNGFWIDWGVYTDIDIFILPGSLLGLCLIEGSDTISSF